MFLNERAVIFGSNTTILQNFDTYISLKYDIDIDILS